MVLKLTESDGSLLYMNLDNVVYFRRSFPKEIKLTAITTVSGSTIEVKELPEEIAKMINVRSIHAI